MTTSCSARGTKPIASCCCLVKAVLLAAVRIVSLVALPPSLAVLVEPVARHTVLPPVVWTGWSVAFEGPGHDRRAVL